MPRKLKSPTRTISNRSPTGRYTGHWRSLKADEDFVFDSISSLLGGIVLERRKDVRRLRFEPRVFWETAAGASTKTKTKKAIPDYGLDIVGRDDGSDYVEVKQDLAALSEEQLEKLTAARELVEKTGASYAVLDIRALNASGYVDTTCLLRRYALLHVEPAMQERVVSTLLPFAPATIREYRTMAWKLGLPLSAVYFVLYHELLPLRYARLQAEELRRCQS
ncbi:MAG: hypothetical protein ACOY5V_18530 [Pseudomonadota bacterium]